MDDAARTLQGEATTAISVLDNDVDNSPADNAGEGLLITSVGVSPDGTIDQQGESFVFTPDADFFGQASFTYTVQDGRRSTDWESTATVLIDVIGRPDQPQPPTIDGVGDEYVLVRWSPPLGDAARAPVTGYILEYASAVRVRPDRLRHTDHLAPVGRPPERGDLLLPSCCGERSRHG